MFARRYFHHFVICFLSIISNTCTAGFEDNDDLLQTWTQSKMLKQGTTLNQITDRGGRLAWYKGTKHELIAFDAISDWKTQNMELYTMQPDGSQRYCVTCDTAIKKGFVGQPAWFPDGEHIIIQVENENSRHTRFNHVSFGFDNDLWIIRFNGTDAERIYKTPPNHAVLHPHFNKNGTLIVFAEREPTGKSRLFWKKITPGGENPWVGWRIHVANFDINKKGTDKLFNHRVLFKGAGGFYETHGFTKNNQIIYSHTAGGKAYVDDIYIANVDGRQRKKILDSSDTWDEHGLFSPSGRSLAFNSSRGDASWRASRSKPNQLKLDLYLRTQSGEIQRLTNMNALMADREKRYVTSDFDWDRKGQRIAFQVAVFGREAGWHVFSPEIWLLTFSEPQ